MLPVETMKEKSMDPQLINHIVRLRDVYNYMLRNPLKKDREYIDYIQAAYKDDNGKPLTKRAAYYDLEILHAIVGNLQQCSKEWHRWRFNNMIQEGYAIAVRKQDAAAIAKLAGMYGKYNRLDRDDEREKRGEIPQLIFCFDCSEAGFVRMQNPYKFIDSTIRQYGGTPMERIMEDADAMEIFEEKDEKKNGKAVSVPE